jgi:hypothetical protein
MGYTCFAKKMISMNKEIEKLKQEVIKKSTQKCIKKLKPHGIDYYSLSEYLEVDNINSVLEEISAEIYNGRLSYAINYFGIGVSGSFNIKDYNNWLMNRK